MPTEIVGEVGLTVKPITDQFSAQVQTAINAAVKGGANVPVGTTGTTGLGQQIQNAVSQASKSVKPMELPLDSQKLIEGVRGALKEAMYKGLAFVGAVGITEKILGFAKETLIGYNSLVEQTTIAFTTLLGSAKAANDEMEQLKNFARTTPFQFSDIIGMSQQLIAMGTPAREVTTDLKALGDTVSGLGQGKETLSRLVYIMGQIRTIGKIQGRDLMELQMVGVNVYDILAQKMNKTHDEVVKLEQAGKLDAATTLPMLYAGLEEKFPDLMKKNMATFQGAKSNILDSLQQIAGALSQPVYKGIEGIMVHIGDSLTDLSTKLQAGHFKEAFLGLFPESIRGTLTSIGDSFLKIVDDVKEMVPAVLGAASAVGGAFLVALRGLLDVLRPIADFIGHNTTLVRDLLIAFAAYKVVQQATAALKAFQTVGASLASDGWMSRGLFNPVVISAGLAVAALIALDMTINKFKHDGKKFADDWGGQAQARVGADPDNMALRIETTNKLFEKQKALKDILENEGPVIAKFDAATHAALAGVNNDINDMRNGSQHYLEILKEATRLNIGGLGMFQGQDLSNLNVATEAMKKLDAYAKSVGVNITDFVNKGDVKGALDAIAKATADAGNAAKDAAPKVEDLAKAYEEAKKAAKLMFDTLKAVSDPGLNVVLASDSIQKSLNTMATGLKDAKGNMESLFTAAEPARTAIMKMGEDMKAAGVPVDQIEASMNKAVTALTATAKAAGYSNKQINEMLGTMGLLPGQIDLLSQAQNILDLTQVKTAKLAALNKLMAADIPGTDQAEASYRHQLQQANAQLDAVNAQIDAAQGKIDAAKNAAGGYSAGKITIGVDPGIAKAAAAAAKAAADKAAAAAAALAAQIKKNMERIAEQNATEGKTYAQQIAYYTGLESAQKQYSDAWMTFYDKIKVLQKQQLDAQKSAATDFESMFLSAINTVSTAAKALMQDIYNPHISGPSKSAQTLIKNAMKETANLKEFSAGIARLKSEGLSDTAIETLGLTGPNSLKEVRKLLTASGSDIATLSSSIGTRAATGQQIAYDQQAATIAKALTDGLTKWLKDHPESGFGGGNPVQISQQIASGGTTDPAALALLLANELMGQVKR